MTALGDLPVTVLGGYLGAGKTTRVNEVLRHANGRRIGVIVNDFGSVNIDEHLIEEQGAKAIGLTNGCVCCSMADGLGSALDELAARAPALDHVLIEASGVAHPRRIANYAQTWPGFFLANISVIVDAQRVETLATDKYVGATVREQIRDADRIVVSHDEVDARQAARTIAWLEAQTTSPVRRGSELSSAELVTALMGQTEGRTRTRSVDATDVGRVNDTPSDEVPNRHTDTHQTVTLDEEAPLSAQVLRGLCRTPPAAIVRAKGWVYLDTEPGVVFNLQGAPGGWTLERLAQPMPPRTCVVVIWADPSITSSTVRSMFGVKGLG